MADKRFFTNAGPITLERLAKLTGATLSSRDKTQPDPQKSFMDVAPLDTAGPNDISFLDNTKYISHFTQSKAGACFVRAKFAERAPEGMALLLVDDPYYSHALAATHLYPDDTIQPGVAPSAIIAKSAILGKNLRIDNNVVIGENVTIGDGCSIGANTVISRGVEIGANTHIGAHCTISHALIGSHCILHRGIHIGTDGFGFAASPRGVLKVPQLGRVIIGNHVEIGSGTCIDRGSGPDTTIGDGSKIDNLIQIGHNVQIGRYVMMAAQVGIAGSTIIEDGVQLGGQVGITGHLTIHAGAKLAAKTGVVGDIPPGVIYGGMPAMPIKDWHRQTITLTKMIKKKTD